MPEVVQAGEGNLGSNSSGAGAVLFDRTVDPLQVHLDNLKSIDEAAQQRAKIQEQKLGLITKMAGALNPDMNGIFPADREFLTQKATEVNQAFQGYMRSGIDPSSPTSGAAFTDFNNRQAQLEGWIQSSKGTNQKMAAYTARLDNDAKGKQELDYGAGSKAMAAIMSLPLDQREKVTDWDSRVIVPAVPALYSAVDHYIKLTNPKPQTTESTYIQPGTNQYMTDTRTVNIRPEQMRSMADSFRTMPAISAAVDRDYAVAQKETPGLTQTLEKPYLDKGLSPVLAREKGKADYLYNQAMAQNYNFSHLVKAGPLDEQGKANLMAIRASTSDEKNVQYDPALMYANFMTGVKGSNNALMNKQLGSYSQLQPKADGNGNPVYRTIKNVVEGAGWLPDGTPYIETSESKDKFAELNLDPSTNLPSINLNGRITFAKNEGNTLAGYFAGRNPTGTDLNNTNKAYVKLGAIDGATGEWDPEKYKSEYARKFGGSQTQATGIAKTAPAATATTTAPATEKRYVVGGKAYKESALKQQGYDVSTLQEYKP